MGWVKFDDASEGHPKFLRAGLAAEGLHKRATCYSSRHLTDGFVPGEWVERNTYDLKARETRDVIAVLIRENLFEPVDGGYLVHDYLDYNPSRVAVLERRESDRKRKGIPPESERNPDGSRPDSKPRVSRGRGRPPLRPVPTRKDNDLKPPLAPTENARTSEGTP